MSEYLAGILADSKGSDQTAEAQTDMHLHRYIPKDCSCHYVIYLSSN